MDEIDKRPKFDEIACASMFLDRIKKLEEALERQTDNMAFVLNHMDVKNWYEKFDKELHEDRLLINI